LNATAAAAVWLALVGPSLFIVHKYIGTVGAAAYAALAAAAVAAAPHFPVPRSRRVRVAVAIVSVAAVVAVFAVMYPIVNVHVPALGSDDDDAYDAGVRGLIAGRSPYTQTTYLGNVLHQLPGAFLLAAPFVIAGTSALQNLFWLPAFFLAVRKQSGDAAALRLSWLVLAMSPTVLHEVITGTGRGSNTIYVALGLWWLTRSRHTNIAGALWGAAVASRANFLLLLPLAFGWLWQRRGARSAAATMTLACGTVAALVVPFYLNDPAHFGPLEAANRLLRFDAVFPHAGIAVGTVMAGAAIVLSCIRMDRAALFTRCAIVQALPVVAGVLLSGSGREALAYATYGTFAAWFLFMATADRFADTSSSRAPIRGGPRSALDPGGAAGRVRR
jgi:hypothetical protein